MILSGKHEFCCIYSIIVNTASRLPLYGPSNHRVSFGCWSFTSLLHVWSYQDGYRLVAVHTHGKWDGTWLKSNESGWIGGNWREPDWPWIELGWISEPNGTEGNCNHIELDGAGWNWMEVNGTGCALMELCETGWNLMELNWSNWNWMELNRIGWNWMELDGTGWNWMELKGTGWNLMELDGTWWKWIELDGT